MKSNWRINRFSERVSVHFDSSFGKIESTFRGGKRMSKEILISTTENIPGRSYEVIGEVFGVTTQSKNMFSNFGASMKNIVGGEIKAYTNMLHESREKAIERLKQEAIDVDADAVVMMRFDSGSIGGDMQSVVAYGTAVKFTD